MNQLLRWLIVSGGALAIGRSLTQPLRRFADAQLARTAWLLLAVSWVVVIAETFLPVMAIPPFGVVLFLLSLVLSIGAVTTAAVLGLVVILRKSDTARSADDPSRISPVIPALIVAAALASFFAERIIGIVAAVNG